jgi:hypothetical protein
MTMHTVALLVLLAAIGQPYAGPGRSSPRLMRLLLTTDKSGGILHVECRQGPSTCCKAPSTS